MGSVAAKQHHGLEINYRGSNDLGTPMIDIPALSPIVFGSGTGNGQADLLFSDQRSVNASTNDDLDLAGVLLDPFGTVLTFVKIVALVVASLSTNTQNFTVGPAAANGFTGPLAGTTPSVQLQPGGAYVACAPNTGWTVTAGTGDILRIANGAGSSISYKILILGRTA